MGSPLQPEEDPLAVLARIRQQRAPAEESPEDVLARVRARRLAAEGGPPRPVAPAPMASDAPDQRVVRDLTPRQAPRDQSLWKTAGTAALTQAIPGPFREKREQVLTSAIEHTRPEELTRTVAEIPRSFVGGGPAGGQRRTFPQRITGADVIAAATLGGAGVREVGYMKVAGPLARAAGAGFDILNQGVARALPGVHRTLRAVAGRSTLASKVAGFVEGTAKGGAETAGFGVGRESMEQGPSAQSVVTGAGYAPLGMLRGIIPAVEAPRISRSRAVSTSVPITPGAPPAEGTDAFAVLGLNRNDIASQFRAAGRGYTPEEMGRVVDVAFREKAVPFHPDQNPTAGAGEVFARLSDAREAALSEIAGGPRRLIPEPTPADVMARARSGQMPKEPPPPEPRPVESVATPQPVRPAERPPVAPAPVVTPVGVPGPSVEVERLARQWVTANTPGRGDPLDVAVTAAEVSRLPVETRNAIKQRASELASQPPAGPSAAPANLGTEALPVAGTPVGPDGWAPPFPLAQGTYEVPTAAAEREPDLMQYKRKTRKLDDVTVWDPPAGGVLALWREPETGRLLVANGHTRHELATRLGVPTVRATFLDEPTAVKARAAAALINIREGSGSATDVGKLMRDTGLTPDDLRARGVPLSSELVRRGVGLSKLASDIFDQVATGTVQEAWGAALGEVLPGDADLQRTALRVAQQAGEKLSEPEMREVARQVSAAGTATTRQETLFGTEEERQSLFVPKAQVVAALRRRLGADHRLFGYVAKEGRAEKLGRAGTTQIDVGAANAIAQEAARGQEVFDRLYARSGPIAKLVHEAAGSVVNGQKAGAAADAIYAAVGDAVRAEIQSGGSGPSVPGVGAGGEVAPAGEGAGPPAPVEPTPEPVGVAGEDYGAGDSTDEAQGGMFADLSPARPVRPPAPSAPPREPERIRAAAIRLKDGSVWEGAIHVDAMLKAQEALNQHAGLDINEIGFVTDTGRFVDKAEAAKIAKRARQVPERLYGDRERVVAQDFGPGGVPAPSAPAGLDASLWRLEPNPATGKMRSVDPLAALLRKTWRETRDALPMGKAVLADVEGMWTNTAPKMDRLAARDPAALQQFYDAFGPARAAIKERFGNTVTLWRAADPVAESGRPFTRWADREFVERLNREEYGGRRAVVSREVPVDDIVGGVFSGKAYREFLVRERPAPSAPAWEDPDYLIGRTPQEPGLLAAEPERGPVQGSLLTPKAGTAATRSTASQLRSIQADLDVARTLLEGTTDPAARRAYAARVADLERAVNPDKKITAAEMAARAAGEAEPTAADPDQLAMLDQDGPGHGGPDVFESRSATVPIAQTERTLRPISPVEMVRLVRDLLGESKIFVKKYPNARGMFYGDIANPRIGLNPVLGKDYQQFAKTLAHEIGHLADYLPEGTLNRGNILGRIATLRSYLQHTIDALPTDPTKALTSKDRRKIRATAEQSVGKRPAKDEEADLAAWSAEVSEKYLEILTDEMDARRLIGKERVSEELIALSDWWTPWDRTASSPSHIAYRDSSRELYAQAVSVLLNSPGTLQTRAPTFFDAFLGYLERKPELARVYGQIQDEIGMGDEAINAARTADLKADFALGEQLRKASEERIEKQPFWGYVKQLLLTKAAPVVDAEGRRLGRSEPPSSEARAREMALQEFNHGDNANRILVEDIVRDVQKPLIDAGLTQDQAGIYLMLRRIAEGDRGGMAEAAKAAIMEATGEDTWEAAQKAYIALGTETAGKAAEDSDFDPDLLEQADKGYLNPRGYTPEEAKRTLAGLAEELGPEKYARLASLIDGPYREILARPVDDAARLGVYSQKAYTEVVLPNRGTYVPFAVLDYFNGRVSAGMRQQIGTVKGIANPYTAGILKAMALTRLNEYQKAKLAVLDKIDTDFPGEIGPEQVIDKHHRETPAGPGRANLVYHVDGRLRYRAMPAYIPDVLAQSGLGQVGRIARILSTKTYGFFHPLYVSWSVAWNAKNPWRDFTRTWKNFSVAHAGKPTYRQALAFFTDLPKILGAYKQTAGVAWRHARMRPDPLIREMLESRALGKAFHSFDPFEGSDTIERIAQRYGLTKPPVEVAPPEPKVAGFVPNVKRAARVAGRAVKESPVGRALSAVGHGVEIAGVFQETWTKAAAYKALGGMGITGRRRAHMTRNFVGTPDSSDRGLASDATNALYLYSNVILAGWRADMSAGTNPTTASGYWFRSFMLTFVPKALAAAAVLGWLGDKYKEFMAHVPSYDLERYIIIPLGYSTNVKGEKKAVYLRIPHDDTNRALAAITWTLLMEHRIDAPSRAIGMASGEFPGVNPAIELTSQWIQFMGNRNPYDVFRTRPVVPTTEWAAGGAPRAGAMLRYSLGQFGVASGVIDWIGSLAGAGLQPAQEPGSKTMAEWVTGHIPAMSALVKVSNRGLTEERWWELDWEARQRARLRTDLPTEVRREVQKRDRLNRLGEDRLNDAERAERDRLNSWYRTYYLPGTSEMELQRDAKNRAGYRDAIRQLDESIGEAGGGRPARPKRPPRPARPRR